jgi:hypothetical protein
VHQHVLVASSMLEAHDTVSWFLVIAGWTQEAERKKPTATIP